MTNITFTIPDATFNEFLETMADAGNYQNLINNWDNSVGTVPTKRSFVKQQLIGFIKQTYKQQKRKVAIDTVTSTIQELDIT